MAEFRKLTITVNDDDPPVVNQIYEICCQAITEAGGYLVSHPEEHTTIVVFGAHQFEVAVTKKR
jgi:hypothetical protein